MNCLDCKFFRPFSDCSREPYDSMPGECRRHAPAYHEAPGLGSRKFPAVMVTDGCGDFEFEPYASVRDFDARTKRLVDFLRELEPRR